MGIAHLLEEFTQDAEAGDLLRLMSDVALEDQRLASFEQGYSAGWDDAIAAQERDQFRITGDLAQNLEDMSFTYHEAMTQFMAATEPVFRSLTTLILPQMLDAAIGPRIASLLVEAVRGQASGPAILTVPVGAAATLRAALPADLPMAVELAEDPQATQGGVRLRVGTAEHDLDTAALLHEIKKAFDAFTHQTSEELRNG